VTGAFEQFAFVRDNDVVPGVLLVRVVCDHYLHDSTFAESRNKWFRSACLLQTGAAKETWGGVLSRAAGRLSRSLLPLAARVLRLP
jgi:hypothetical protein